MNDKLEKEFSYISVIDTITYKFLKRARRLKEEFENLPTSPSFDDWNWMEQFTREGNGLNICCGDFPIGGAYGVDAAFVLGTFEGLVCESAINLPHLDNNTCDYIVSNYLDGLPSPIIALREWNRILKPKGTLAIICRNADDEFYQDTELGPLKNKKRLICFTPKIMRFYLTRTNYTAIKIELGNGTIKVLAKKGEA